MKQGVPTIGLTSVVINVVMLEISVLVNLVTPAFTGCNRNDGLKAQPHNSGVDE